jgi:hypothetical protein
MRKGLSNPAGKLYLCGNLHLEVLAQEGLQEKTGDLHKHRRKQKQNRKNPSQRCPCNAGLQEEILLIE